MNFSGDAPMIDAALLFPILIGGAYGYASTKGQFCMNSGFSNVTRNGDTTKLKSFATAILIQMTVLPILFTLLSGVLSRQSYIHSIGVPSTFLVANLVGGFIFGISMYYSAGCGAGIFYKIGEKNSGAILSTVGFIAGVYLMSFGYFKEFREDVQQYMTYEQTPIWQIESSVLISVLISIVSILCLYLLFKGGNRAPKGAVWAWKKTGIVIGIIGILGWLSAMQANNSFGLSIIPGALDLVDQKMSWVLMLLLGIPIGAYVGNLKTTTRTFFLPKPKIGFKRFFGGIGLGLSGAFAAGCTVGHGLTFAPFLALGSLLTMLSIFLGSAMMGYLTRK